MSAIFYLLELISLLYWVGMIVLLFASLLLIPRVFRAGWPRNLAAAVALIGILAYFYFWPRWNPESAEEKAAREQAETAKAIFAERCKTAGEKIYRTAKDVEGITLLNVYPDSVRSNKYIPEQDPMWHGAALPDQQGGERYILSFLGWSERFKETLDFTSRYTSLEKPRYQFNENLSSQITIPYKNYSYIDIEDQESYFFRYKIHPDFRLNGNKYLFNERMNKNQGMSNYAVYYKSIVEPKDRLYWIAGAEVSIIDQSNKQIMARKTWYAFAPSMRPVSNGSWAWHHAIHCPKDGEYGDPVVKFVISVVQPKQGE